jgi:hypothetical protein
MRAEIPRIDKRLIATCIRGVSASSAIDHVEGDCLGLSYPLTATFSAVGRDNCKPTHENLERSHFPTPSEIGPTWHSPAGNIPTGSVK